MPSSIPAPASPASPLPDPATPGPPPGRLTCRRAGEDLVITMPPQSRASVLAATLPSDLPLLLAIVAWFALVPVVLRHTVRPELRHALLPILFFAPLLPLVRAHRRNHVIARMELTLKLRKDRLWLNYVCPRKGPRPDNESTIITTGGGLDADLRLAHTIVCSWRWEEIASVFDRFGQLRIAGRRDLFDRRATVRIRGLRRSERRWIIRTLQRYLYD